MWNEIDVEITLENFYKLGYTSKDILKKTNITPEPTVKFKYNDLNSFYVPLQFWFNKSPNLAIPIIAMNYSETIIGIST